MARLIEIIAEIGVNWQGEMSLAAEMIQAAKEAGADVAKFQIYVLERALDVTHPLIIEHYDTIKATELSFNQVVDLKNLCDAAEIEFLASVFHPDRVPWTEAVGMKRYKIASRSVYNEELAEAIAKTGKPVICSLSPQYYYNESKLLPSICAFETEYDLGVIKWLYCVSLYPTPLGELYLPEGFGRWYVEDYYDGFSDHTIGITAAVVAMSRGATIIEKHFTLDKSLPGPDHACSIEPAELGVLCTMRDEIEEILLND